MEFGPDGALYVLDYGTGWFSGDANSALYRIEYIGGGHGHRSPRRPRHTDLRAGAADREVLLGRAADPDGDALTYAWDFGDGGTSTAANPTHTYTANGKYTATLTVRDPQA